MVLGPPCWLDSILSPHPPAPHCCVSICFHGGMGDWDGSRLSERRDISLLTFHLAHILRSGGEGKRCPGYKEG